MNENIVYYFAVFITAYLFGSFPSAYLIVKLTSKKDVRKEGSGNVGTLNALRASKSKSIAAIVLILDLLKGWLPAYFITKYFAEDFFIIMAVVIGVLLGHIFSMWLKFQGGRGLAVTAGALLVISPLSVAIWLATWILFYIFLRKHIVVSLIATFLLPVIVFFISDSVFNKEILLVVLPVCFIIFLKHIERVPDMLTVIKK